MLGVGVTIETSPSPPVFALILDPTSMLHSESLLTSKDFEGEVSIVTELSKFESPESDSYSDKLPLLSVTD